MNALSSSAVTIEDGDIAIAADLLVQQPGLSVEALKAQTRRGCRYSLSMALTGMRDVRELNKAILRDKRKHSKREDSIMASGSKNRQSPEAARRDLDTRLNEALELTFPCSDPIAVYVERAAESDEDPEAGPEPEGEQN